ncbi:MAG: hypothetical protein O6918_00335, partial [Deltaproteobacteria bacterium]|nr:hypothetical protein [Deltaproteobacteria bacterium]
SMLHIMIRLATLVSVPSEHVTEGRTVPSLALNSGIKEDSGRLIEISHWIPLKAQIPAPGTSTAIRPIPARTDCIMATPKTP